MLRACGCWQGYENPLTAPDKWVSSCLHLREQRLALAAQNIDAEKRDDPTYGTFDEFLRWTDMKNEVLSSSERCADFV